MLDLRGTDENVEEQTKMYCHLKPGTYKEGDKVTPGRVGNVFFFPKASFDKLHDKPNKWNWMTRSGTLADVGESSLAV